MFCIAGGCVDLRLAVRDVAEICGADSAVVFGMLSWRLEEISGLAVTTPVVKTVFSDEGYIGGGT